MEWTIQWRTESFDGGLYEFVTNDRLNSYLSLRISTNYRAKKLLVAIMTRGTFFTK